MRDIMTIAKKELRAFLTDKVLLIQIFILGSCGTGKQ